MKRTLLLCALLGGCATSPSRAEQLRAQYREAESERRAAQSNPQYRSGDGFQQTRWGMTVDEVKTLYPEAKPAAGGLEVDGLLAEQPAHLHFGFVDNRLAEVRGVFKSPGDVLERFDSVSELVSKKYGEPVDRADARATGPNGEHLLVSALDMLTALGSRTDAERADAQQQTATHQLQFEQENATRAAAAARAPRGATWLHASTRIILAAQPEGAGELAISYQSRALWMDYQARQTQDAKQSEAKAVQSL